MTMADTIAVMNAGVVEQLGSPGDLYESPRTTFVANFLGQSNLLAGEVTGRSGEDLVVEVQGTKLSVRASRAQATDGQVWIGVRPEKVHLAPQREQTEGNTLGGGRVVDVSFVGVSTQYLVTMPWDQNVTVFEQNTGARAPLTVGQEVDLHWSPEHAFVLDHHQDARAGVESLDQENVR